MWKTWLGIDHQLEFQNMLSSLIMFNYHTCVFFLGLWRRVKWRAIWI